MVNIGKVVPQNVNFDFVLPTNKNLTKKEREILELAHQLITALHSMDIDAIYSAYVRICDSPYYQELGITQLELDRVRLLKEDRDRLSKMPIEDEDPSLSTYGNS